MHKIVIKIPQFMSYFLTVNRHIRIIISVTEIPTNGDNSLHKSIREPV